MVIADVYFWSSEVESVDHKKSRICLSCGNKRPCSLGVVAEVGHRILHRYFPHGR